MSEKAVPRYKRSLLKELESNIRHLRYNIKYSVEMFKTLGGRELLNVLLFNFKKEKEFYENKNQPYSKAICHPFHIHTHY